MQARLQAFESSFSSEFFVNAGSGYNPELRRQKCLEKSLLIESMFESCFLELEKRVNVFESEVYKFLKQN